ncbi:MAG TPA: PKD domain-containing protein, partial [Candidatus Lokiarchaeia archaeon]|nr:PKD domain-containing protein [Candidatus Lokiarchaeia archaeon]
PLSFKWNFGDGTGNFTTQNVAHQFNVAGTYTVALTVTDANGDVSVFETSIVVTAASTEQPPNNTLLIAIAIIAAAALITVGLVVSRKKVGRTSQVKSVVKSTPVPPPVTTSVPPPVAAPVPPPATTPEPVVKTYAGAAPEVPPPDMGETEDKVPAAPAPTTQGEREQQLRKVLLEERKRFVAQAKELEKLEMYAKLKKIALRIEQISDQLYRMGDPAEAQNVKQYRKLGQKYAELAEAMQKKTAEKDQIKAKYKPKKGKESEKYKKRINDL